MENFVQRKGGPGSGHHGHAGRPGFIGGSTPLSVISIMPAGGSGQPLDEGRQELFNEIAKTWKGDRNYVGQLAVMNNTHDLLALREKGEAVGVLSLSEPVVDQEPLLRGLNQIMYFATKRPGYGYKMIEGLQERIRATKGKGVFLESSPAAIKFYEKVGLTKVEEVSWRTYKWEVSQ